MRRRFDHGRLDALPGRAAAFGLGLLALVLALEWAPAAVRAGQAATPGPSPARETGVVVGYGTASLPTSDAVWRVLTDTIPAGKGRAGDDRAPGFFLVETGRLVVGGPDLPQTEVGSGEAVFLAGGSRRWQAGGGEAATYYALELLAPDAVGRGVPPAGEVLAVTDPFPVPVGRRVLGLVRGELGRFEYAEATDIGGAALVLAAAGEITVRGGDGAVTLRAGEAALVEGAFVIASGGCGGAIFATAVVLPEEGDATPVPSLAPPIAGEEVFAGTGNADADELGDDAERGVGTDPNDPDSDDDGLCDGQEVNGYGFGTDPLAADSDGDGVGDGDEVNRAGTEPLDPDSDDDGIEDGAE